MQSYLSNLVHDIGAYKIRPEDPLVTKYGFLFPDFIDFDCILSHPSTRESVKNNFLASVSFVVVDKYHFVATSDEPHDVAVGYGLASQMSAGFAIVRQGLDGSYSLHGLDKKSVEGKIFQPVSAFTTSGITADEVAACIETRGGIIHHHMTVFDRNLLAKDTLSSRQSLTDRRRHNAIELIPLCAMDNDFYNTVLNKEYDKRQLDAIQTYTKDPTVWAENFLLNNPAFVKRRLTQSVKNGKIVDSSIVNTFGLAYILTQHPKLMDMYTPLLQKWLQELAVVDEVPVVGYYPKVMVRMKSIKTD